MKVQERKIISVENLIKYLMYILEKVYLKEKEKKLKWLKI